MEANTKYDRLQDDQNQPVMTQPGVANPPPYSGPEYPQQGYPAQGYPPQGYPSQPAGVSHTTTNVVVVNQQPTFIVQGKRDWHSGMCACFDDMGSCCCAIWCPMCLLYEITQKMGEDCCFCLCCPLEAMFGLRVQLRTEQNIQGSLCNDYCSIIWCQSCVLCQMSRELKHLGR
ncbi:cornifelin homolog [Actinia tenebrosa]|uniref:Cornifelin homolog n=1 Tax=Actinia tenebrosa TaxID=6105 RepID=A0A6P8IXP6_ACTTE|nr:cornifelin homolog [Actinia tenebrosa]